MRFKVENSRLFRLRTTQKDENVYFNEVNTIPGCTSHSRYPSMLNKIGISFPKVIDKLIKLGLER